ncbi:hypothetical protein [Streptomyces sp. H39-S7]|uniref:hypothetical protein n=1 Tax=Streptomyces sp. H39-S7 TaxID=3004357 RepID=UPI0022AFE5FA|nr:hypothetical protein [Streptomyces sp. H39-S7]MCZ4125000.1 hypothetical protein [Streptomyces sp. H39-S7]
MHETAPAAAAEAKAALAAKPGPRADEPLERTPGVELLLSIAATKPEFYLTGDVLRDQAVSVTSMLAVGFRAEHIWQIVAGEPLPPREKIRASVGAIVSWRLSQAMRAGAPRLAPKLPAQPSSQWDHGNAEETWTPPTLSEQTFTGYENARLRDCEGDNGLCKKLAVAGEPMCAEHLGWALCPQCQIRRMQPGLAACEGCGAFTFDDDLAATLPRPTTAAEQETYYESGQFERDAHGHVPV